MTNRLHTLLSTLIIASLIATLSSCSGIHYGHIFAVPDAEAEPLPNSNGVISMKNNLIVAAAAQNEVKEADAFYFAMFNRAGEFVSFDRSKIRARKCSN